MRSFLKELFGQMSARRSTPRRPPRAQLGLEALEQREVTTGGLRPLPLLQPTAPPTVSYQDDNTYMPDWDYRWY
jgi:hypothetical protein